MTGRSERLNPYEYFVINLWGIVERKPCYFHFIKSGVLQETCCHNTPVGDQALLQRLSKCQERRLMSAPHGLSTHADFLAFECHSSV